MRRRRSQARLWGAMGAGLVVGVLLLTSFSLGEVSATIPTDGTLQLQLGSSVTEPANFWGMNIGSDQSAGSTPVTKLLETPTKLLVYPAGNNTERMDFSTNTLYGVGSKQPAVVTVQDFISYCEAISCEAIMELPMEINNTTTTAMEASYVVNTLGFHPAFFAYGNEPSHWFCFGISWAALAAGQPCDTGNTTPVAFATETEAAIQAVTAALGPSTPPAMCLNAGTGNGWENDVAWINALEANPYDNSTCAVYAMHVKPAHSQTADPTLANFYATLTGPQALPADYQNASQLLYGKPLYMDEVGWSTPHSVYTPVFTGTWAENVLQSALVVQAMQLHIPMMGWWAWNEGASLHQYAPAPFWTIYTKLFPKLGTTWYPTQYTGQNGTFAEATQSGKSWTLLMVSTNITESFHIGLNGSGFPDSGKATVYTVTSSGWSRTAIPHLTDGFTLPAQSVVMVITTA